jgi:hypothetical protein
MNGKACSLAVILLGVVLVAGAGQAETLWTIGVPDGQYKELAIAGRHADYVARFPNDVVFRVPRSKPDQDWPFIQPGPGDAWAGGRAHPFRIEFRLNSKPHGGYRLNIFLVDTHSTSPPVLEINVNGRSKHTFQLPAGGGDGALTDPKAGRKHSIPVVFPADALNKGPNVITLTAVEHSWLLYDAILLESGVPGDGPDVSAIEASSSPFFRSENGELRQAIRLKANNLGLEGDCEIALSGARQESRQVHLVEGENAFTILVKPFERPEAVHVTMTTPARKKEADLEGRPERKWKIYVAPSAHTDIGYTDLQERIFERHNSNTAAALKACETHPDFKWNLEVFAQADWYRKQGDDAFKTLEQRIIEGRIGLTSLYLNMLTGLCSGEEMVKVLEPAQSFGRAHNVPVTVATLTDVPTAVGTLPMFLNQAGVKYFAEGINEDRGPVFKYADKRMIQSPFWWEGLDGSRVMAVFTRGYAQAGALGLRDGVEALERRLPGWIQALDQPDYPCDALYANGAFSDNESVTTRYIEVASDWNKAWEFPQIIVARADEFFQYVDQNFAQDLPVFRGDMGSYWEDGAASSAYETGMNRTAKARLNIAERWFALTAAQDPKFEFPRADFAKAWEDAMYYDEHTWGAAGSISDPRGEQTVKQWEYKASYARRATEMATNLFQRCGQEILDKKRQSGSRGEDGGNYLVVFNECSWPRDIEVPIADGGKTRFFVAKQVPPMGYRHRKSEALKADPEWASLLHKGPDQYTWETPSFRYRIDPKTGAFSSIEDLRTHREWVDASSGYGVNQFLYVTGGKDTSLVHPGAKAAPALQPVSHVETEVQMLPAAAGFLPSLNIVRKGPGLPCVTTTCWFLPDGHLQLLNRVVKEETTEKEAGYFAFPFKLDAPDNARTFFDLPYGIVEADREQPPGADREWYAANSFAAVSDDEIAAYVATREAPLFTVGNMNRGAWPAKVDNNRGTVFAYVFNNYWHTNYKASQGGRTPFSIPFSFAIKLTDRGFDPVAATRFGCEHLMGDPVLHIVPARGAEESLIKMDDGPVMLAELTQDDSGRLLARLYNPSDEAASTSLEFPRLRIKNAWKTDLFGHNEEAIPVKLGRKIPASVPARGIATLVIETQAK